MPMPQILPKFIFTRTLWNVFTSCAYSQLKRENPSYLNGLKYWLSVAMEKNNPLLPFAFTSTSSLSQNDVQLNTTPRSRATIDENAKSIYHTRVGGNGDGTNTGIGANINSNRPTLGFAPTLKRRMGESFNEKDDVKRRVRTNDYDDPESEEPTMVDSTSTDFLDYDDYKRSYSTKDEYHSTSVRHDGAGIPSSPPVAPPNLSSDFECNNPINKFNLPSESSPTKLRYVNKTNSIMQHKLGSEPDFGIDQFNRFRPSANQCPSTDTDFTSSIEDNVEKQRMLNLKARDIVIEAFEEMKTSIDLEGMGLTEVPHEIKDMNNLVVIGNELTQPIYQLYLTNNKIRVLSPALFKFTKLNVLTLRQNKIERIPALIKNMINLTDLSLGTNRLKYLPHQILDLPRLATFRAGPNPYLKIPENAICATTVTLNPIKTKKYISKIKYFKNQSQVVKSLKSICLATIATYDVSYQETKEWKRNTPRLYHNLIIDAISRGNYKETCAECNCISVEPFAEVIEWWDILQNRDIPFKKEFCSGACTRRYRRMLMEDSNYEDDDEVENRKSKENGVYNGMDNGMDNGDELY